MVKHSFIERVFPLQCSGTAGVSPRSPIEGVLPMTNGVGYQTRVSNHSKLIIPLIRGVSLATMVLLLSIGGFKIWWAFATS